MKINYDPDVPSSIRPSISQMIDESDIETCSCGCDEIYVTLQKDNRLDVKCYDCGSSYFELEMEVKEETLEN